MTSIAQQRLVRQSIACSNHQTPTEVVAWMGAIQGQDYSGGKWSIGLRLPEATDAQIEQDIAEKRVVRTWLMRGTLHLVAAEDLRWITALVAPRIIAKNARRYRELELDDATLHKSADIIGRVVRDGGALQRAEIATQLEAEGISCAGQRIYYMLERASLEMLICQTTAPKNNPVFVALDGSIPGAPLPDDEALALLARRYFFSRGPATLDDFVWWCGLPVGEARAGLHAIQGELVQEQVSTQVYWMPTATVSVPAGAPRVVLLPGFDEYLIAYRDRSASLDPQYATWIVPGGNGIFKPAIVSDGRVVGTWQRTFKKNTVILTPQPFDVLADYERAGFAAAAQRFARFLGMPALLNA